MYAIRSIQCAQSGIAESSKFNDQIQQEAERDWSAVPDLTDDTSHEKQSNEGSFDIWEEDRMSYPYSKYRDGANAKVHVCDFLTTWEANHVSRRLWTIEEEESNLISSLTDSTKAPQDEET